MKTKKSTKANLENKRSLFFQIGFILALTSILAAFEWSVKVAGTPEIIFRPGDEPIELSIPVTRPEQEKQNQVKAPMPAVEPIVVPDKTRITEEPFFLPTDENDYTIPPFEPPVEKFIDSTYIKVEIYPKFMGKGDKAFREWIMSQIRFPDDAVENGLSGKVQVQFIVGIDGKLYDIKIVRGVHPAIDKEVLRVISNSPEWEPAVQSGRYVKAMYGIIIHFQLQ
ncbi:MAG: hypothetical protein A2X13_11240 [Bacteroidetes bacterium GWC2_33_15]|nr:MAG: hypothetical protein A2X10_10970 [Bacteroidetes bacterium GWA2_33_15]OFX52619.1 MAG: hypothetical protein A2X13_11240 [Bacteroidetes bacterium GWC2_33_15]OFX63964.1 MAG: hypothetical protein A2X15_03585 [Bacteroidetes bacterium GWB2_32_14]OFX70769.1 MAG: hypothetical protein A2X14_00005 [Bacteroidetes bacterium GWD2_33_33]HAN19897.1 hypothetical protein [Bacteroidales bacterium]